MIKFYSNSNDIAIKLFREAGRTWNADNIENMADHLYNFCVTNSSLRDWIAKEKGIPKNESKFQNDWRAMADGLFGECADIANASKHFLIKKSEAIHAQEELLTLTPYGVIDDSKITRDTFQIVLSNDKTIDLLKFLHKICIAWENYFKDDRNLEPLPEYGYYLLRSL